MVNQITLAINVWLVFFLVENLKGTIIENCYFTHHTLGFLSDNRKFNQEQY